MTLKAELRQKLDKAKRVAFLGIGSELRGDDAAGVLVVEKLAGIIKKPPKNKKIRFFNGGTAPENLTGEIKRFKPTHLVIIDSAHLKKEPGSISLLDSKMICGSSFSTHRLPLKILADYLGQFFRLEVIFVGIQPESFGYCVSPTGKVQRSIHRLSRQIGQLFCAEVRSRKKGRQAKSQKR
ncbi:MAG: hydrogenase maturation peptidase HycI [Candidatus Omnitrophica bacterium]|nr:hydrogenase maturation peptidase HycI [Candidatus Omnitrophota bacterium]